MITEMSNNTPLPPPPHKVKVLEPSYSDPSLTRIVLRRLSKYTESAAQC